MVEYVWDGWGMKAVEGAEELLKLLELSVAISKRMRNGPVRPFKIRIKNGPRVGEEVRDEADWLDPETNSRS